MDENQQQSKTNKSADEVVSSIVNIFLANYVLVIKRYMLCLIFVLGIKSFSFGFVNDTNEKCILCKER